MPKYFVEPENIKDNNIIITGEDVKHISTVLRAKLGDVLEVCNGCSEDFECKIKEISKEQIELEIVSKKPCYAEPKAKITLFQGLPKADKMELIIQKCVEIGIDKIVPVATERSVVKLNDKEKIKKVERWQKISLSAAKQSGRGIIPKIEDVISYNEAIKVAKTMQKAIIFYENEAKRELKEILKNIKDEEIGIFIGPEGGFANEEINKAKTEGLETASLGERVLRTETAAVVATAILLYELG